MYHALEKQFESKFHPADEETLQNNIVSTIYRKYYYLRYSYFVHYLRNIVSSPCIEVRSS